MARNYPPATPKYGADARRLRIGIMGGSFNPAHQAHLDISLDALKHLKLDEVWWLVSPASPS
jgi:nicotinate-nucleotide adenylyltransferase